MSFASISRTAHTTATPKSIERVRGAAKDAGRIIALLQDFSGPKIRTGKLRDGKPVTLEDGDALPSS